jgi:hypothetical protein
MPTPTWVPGQILTASDVNNWLVVDSVIKPLDTGRASNTTIADDPDLQIALAANSSYRLDGMIFYDGLNSVTLGGMQFTWSGPSGYAMEYAMPGRMNQSQTYTIPLSQIGSDVVQGGTVGVSSTLGLAINGIVIVGGTAGTLKFRWAQIGSTSTITTVRANSLLTVQRIA